MPFWNILLSMSLGVCEIYTKYILLLFGRTFRNVCYTKTKRQNWCYVHAIKSGRKTSPGPLKFLFFLYFFSWHNSISIISVLSLSAIFFVSELIWRFQMSTLPKPPRWMPHNCCHILDYHQDTLPMITWNPWQI